MSIPSLAPSVVVLKALNALLRREPWASQELSAYSGKTVLIRFAGKDILKATINSVGGLDICDPIVSADVVLDLPFSDISELVKVFRSQGADGIAKQMHIQGDAGLAQLLADLSRNLRWDAQADLANVFGDIAAVRITGFMRMAFNGVQDGVRRLNNNIQDYMLNESDLAVRKSELQVLQSGVADINKRLDKLASSLNQLDNQVSALARD